jgi:hypothetical protein
LYDCHRRIFVVRAPPGDRPFTTIAAVPRPQLGDLEIVIGRFRFVVIAIAVVIIAGFAVLGAQIWLMNARIDQLATKVNGIDATFGVKFEETNAKLDAASTKLDGISQQLPAEFKTIGAEITAQASAITKSIASLRGLAPSPPTSLLPEPATGPRPAPPPKPRP